MNKSSVIFILLAVAVFAAGAAWKFWFNGQPVATTEVVQPVVEISKPRVAKVQPKPAEEKRDIYIPKTLEERDQVLEQRSEMMQLHMMYAVDPNQLLLDINTYKEMGNQEKVDQLIDYLVTYHPDYEVPEGLLD